MSSMTATPLPNVSPAESVMPASESPPSAPLMVTVLRTVLFAVCRNTIWTSPVVLMGTETASSSLPSPSRSPMGVRS